MTPARVRATGTVGVAVPPGWPPAVRRALFDRSDPHLERKESPSPLTPLHLPPPLCRLYSLATNEVYGRGYRYDHARTSDSQAEPLTRFFGYSLCQFIYDDFV